MAFISWFLPPYPETPATAPYSDPETGKINHASSALSRVRQQFKNSPNYLGLVEILAGSEQNNIEDALWDLYTLRGILTGTGLVLDSIGVLVGCNRDGATDDDYRRILLVKVSVNRSHGLRADLMKVCRGIVNDEDAEFSIASSRGTATIYVSGVSLSSGIITLLLTYLQRAVKAGIRVIIINGPADPDDAFKFARATTLSAATLALATTLPVLTTEGFPDSGTLIIDQGLAVEETVTYTGKTSTTFFGLSVVANAHTERAAVQVAGTSTQGFGDSTNPAVGGQMVGAWS